MEVLEDTARFVNDIGIAAPEKASKLQARMDQVYDNRLETSSHSRTYFGQEAPLMKRIVWDDKISEDIDDLLTQSEKHIGRSKGITVMMQCSHLDGLV